MKNASSRESLNNINSEVTFSHHQMFAKIVEVFPRKESQEESLNCRPIHSSFATVNFIVSLAFFTLLNIGHQSVYCS